MMRVKVGKPLIDVIRLCYEANRPPLLIGRHGIGKSESLRQAASDLHIDFISRDLSLMEPPDLVGIPKTDRGVTQYCPPAFLPTEGKGLIVFEEINRCEKYMRAPCLQLLTERCLNDYRLPPRWLPAAAINPQEGYETFELDPALLSRFVQIEVEPDRQEWLVWARAQGIHSAILRYVQADPDIFVSPDSNPRSWAYVADILKAGVNLGPSNDALRAAVIGLVGEKRGVSFLAFLKEPVRPLTAEDILSAYGAHQTVLRQWWQAGKLELVRSSLMSLLKMLQARQNFEAARRNRRSWANLSSFGSDLHGDLREQFERV